VGIGSHNAQLYECASGWAHSSCRGMQRARLVWSACCISLETPAHDLNSTFGARQDFIEDGRADI
jgi:hypothetical protein